MKQGHGAVRFRVGLWVIVTGLAAMCAGVVQGDGGRAGEHEADVAALLDGVKAVAAPGTPAALTMWSEDAFAVVEAGETGERVPVIVAGEFGRGRFVLFPHSGYCSAEVATNGDTGRFMENAARWAARGKTGEVRVGCIGGNLHEFFTARGFVAQAMKDDWVKSLGSLDVVCCSHVDLTDAQIEALRGFIRRGGGFFGIQTPWGWQQLSGNKPMSVNGMNRLMEPAGVAWTNGYSGATAEGGLFAVREFDRDLLNGRTALKALQDGQKAEGGAGGRSPEELKQAGATVLAMVRALPKGERVMRGVLESLLKDRAGALAPTKEKPLTVDHPLDRVLLAYQMEEMNGSPAARTPAHPAAAAFPGAVPADARRVTRSVAIDTSLAGWASTGLYAGPGEMITVSIPQSAVGNGLRVRIGAHSDGLWHADAWNRVPEITRSWPLDEVRTQMANPFGGPVYVEVPDGCALGSVEVKIAGAVEAPMFVLGTTTHEDWVKSIRDRPGPWAELVTRKVALTVPSSCTRSLDDPESLMRFWDSILDAAADLRQIPRDRAHPQRYCMDVQISAGYMHSGYPIMTHMDVCDDFTRLDVLKKGSWGLFHELGHNHQHGDWTFDGTGEVTCNLWSLYLIQTVCGVPWESCHEGIKRRPEQIRTYVEKGRRFQDWKADPFLALIMYQQMVEGFGWEPFKKVFAEYEGLQQDERPKGEDEKRDQWMVRFSRAVGRNLGSFFEAWGVPTSASAGESIKDLPAWMPDDMVPVK